MLSKQSINEYKKFTVHGEGDHWRTLKIDPTLSDDIVKAETDKLFGALRRDHDVFINNIPSDFNKGEKSYEAMFYWSLRSEVDDLLYAPEHPYTSAELLRYIRESISNGYALSQVALSKDTKQLPGIFRYPRVGFLNHSESCYRSTLTYQGLTSATLNENIAWIETNLKDAGEADDFLGRDHLIKCLASALANPNTPLDVVILFSESVDEEVSKTAKAIYEKRS